MKIRPLRRRSTLLLIFFVLVLGLTGCGGESERSVSGKVLFNGQPVPDGSVSFWGGADGKETAACIIDSDGKYTLIRPMLGEVKITVTGPSRTPSGAKPSVVLPARYNDPNLSKLTYTVKEGKQEHDIEMTP